MVASDRVSAFDHVLSPGIPGKGELLTTLSLWWFDRLAGVPNHLVADHELRDDSVHEKIPDAVAGRAMLARTLDMYPIECVVRGYLAGSGWLEYREHQTVCGVALPAGLTNGDRLPEPIYTPAWKAPLGAHDENIPFERTVELVGSKIATALRDLSLEVFSRASAIADDRGHQIRIRCQPRHRCHDPRGRSADERQFPVLGFRGLLRRWREPARELR
jgi:phosphoribosylaminoimidazole-succinocarboxamide synthase